MTRGGRTLELTRLEVTLLTYLIDREGENVGRGELLAGVWGYSPRTATRAVDQAIARLRSKLGDARAPRHLRTVWGRGYRFDRAAVGRVEERRVPTVSAPRSTPGLRGAR